MGNILVVAEHSDGALRKVTLSSIAFAKQLAAAAGGDTIGLVLGSGQRAVADQMAKYGLTRVIHVDNPAFAEYLSESYAPAVVDVTREVNATTVCVSASMLGKDFAPRVASTLEAGMVGDVIAVEGDGGEVRYKRPMFAGSIVATVAVDTPIAVVTVRPTDFDAAAEGGESPVEDAQFGKASELSTFVSFDAVVSERPDLNDANVIVSGGRGMKNVEGFGLLEQLADTFGGAVGASRAATDAGMCAGDLQIGQTGKIVAPDLYFAVAISGAIQHVAGMKGSKYIVAINKDPEAPIFQIADYGLVADAFKVMPELTEKIAAVKAEG